MRVHSSRRARWVVVAATLVLCASAAASPLVKREQSAPSKPKPVPIAEELAGAASQAYGTPVAEAELARGIPKSLHAIFANQYQDENLDRLVTKYAAYATEFEARWAKVDQHRREVDAAIAKARELAKAKDYEQAKTTLLGVLTGIAVNHDGSIGARTNVLEAMDAELPALYQLALVARDARDPYVLPDIAAAFAARRRLLGSKPAELLIWLSYQAARAHEHEEGNVLRAFGAGQVNAIGRALQRIDDTMFHLFKKDGSLIAQGFFHSMKDYGLPTGHVFVRDSATPGSYALFDLIPGPGITTKITAGAVLYKADITQQIPKNCRETNKIDGYDPISRRFTYRSVCDYETKRTKASLKAKLATAPADWAAGDNKRVWVLGKVKKAGNDWELVDAQIADFRFLGPMALLDFGDVAATLF